MLNRPQNDSTNDLPPRTLCLYTHSNSHMQIITNHSCHSSRLSCAQLFSLPFPDFMSYQDMPRQDSSPHILMPRICVVKICYVKICQIKSSVEEFCENMSCHGVMPCHNLSCQDT